MQSNFVQKEASKLLNTVCSITLKSSKEDKVYLKLRLLDVILYVQTELFSGVIFGKLVD